MPMEDDLNEHEMDEVNTSSHSIIHEDILTDNFFHPKTQGKVIVLNVGRSP